jgi:transposase
MVKKRKPGAAARQQFTVEERAAAVELVRSSRRPVTAVAAELGMSDKTLNQWVLQARNTAIDPGGSLSDAARRRIRELEAQVARLERDLEFEKKAGAFIRNRSPRTDGSK